MTFDLVTLLLGFVIIASSLGVILFRKPVHAALSFLLTLLTLAVIYFQLEAEFIAAMQILVYAGAILVIFIFVIVLFQDAYRHIETLKPATKPAFLYLSAAALLLAFGVFVKQLIGLTPISHRVPEGFGTVQALGQALYVDYFFPFEAVILIFLIALVGAVYIGKKV